MKRNRIISAILAIGMVLSFLPTPTYAADANYSGTHAAHNCAEAADVVEVANFTNLDAALERTDNVDIVITGNITLTGTINVVGTKHVYVASGEHTLTRGFNNGALFTVPAGATLILGNGTMSYDNANGKLLAKAAEEGAYSVNQLGGSLIIDGGAIWGEPGDVYTPGPESTKNFYNQDGRRAVFFDENGVQRYYDNTNGVVADESMITNSGTLNIWSGVTMQNAATEDIRGAAINSGENATLNMYGGTIKMCAAAGSISDSGIGGAIFAGAVSNYDTKGAPISTFNMYGGSIINNAVPARATAGLFSLTNAGGTQDGGGIALDRATMNLYGGSVSYNHAGVYNHAIGGITYAGDGGGIMVRCGSVLNMWGGKIDHNYAGGYGGGVVAWNGNINIHGGAIEQNVASFGAGIGIAAYQYSAQNDRGSVVNMSGGTVAYNEAILGGVYGGFGGGICAGSAGYPQAAVLNLSGGTIQQNKADYGGGVAVYASTGTYADLSGSFVMTGNFAYYNGNGMYITNRNAQNTHSLVRLSEGARVDTNNPVFFDNVTTSQIPVQVSGTLTTTGTAAIFEFSDSFWTTSNDGYAHPSTATNATPLAIVNFRDGNGNALDIQENKIALESSTWYLKANHEGTNDLGRNTLDLQSFSTMPQYTIRNGTPENINGTEYYKLYSSLADAFADAESGETLYIFYNTTITTPAVLNEGKNITLLAESSSTAGLAASSAEGTANAYKTTRIDTDGDGKLDYYRMTGNFILYGRGDNTTTSYTYNVRNDYTITLSSTLALGAVNKYDANGDGDTGDTDELPSREAAIVIEDGAQLGVGRIGGVDIGYGSLTFDGNLSYPKEGAMFSVGGTNSQLTLYDGVTIMNHSNYSEAHPGAIEVAANGTLTMSSGVTLSGNVSPVAGAVYVAAGGSFTMNGGSISGNYGALPRYGFDLDEGRNGKIDGYDIAYWGQPKFYHGAGGVYSEGSFTMNGGTIEKNRGEYGGIASMMGTLRLVSGSITDNHAHTGNGSSGMDEPCDLTITDYDDSKAPQRGDSLPSAGSGGGVYIGDGSTSASIGAVTVSGNTAEKNGGGIAVGASTSSLVRAVSGYTTVDDAEENLSESSSVTTSAVPARVPTPGAVTPITPPTTHDAIKGLPVTVTGASVTNNTAGAMGGGIYLAAKSTLDVDATTSLRYNTAANGGGIAVNGEGIKGSYTVETTGVTTSGAVANLANTITENTATGNGGGVYARGSGAIVAVTGTLSANVAHNGGGAAVDYIDSTAEPMPEGAPATATKRAGATLVLAGATVNNNTADGEGVGVYNDGTLVFTPSTKQPFVGYGDIIYLAKERVVTLDTYYNINSSSQTATNRLTVDSEITANGTDIFKAADGTKASELLNSNRVAHLNGNLSLEYTNGSPNGTVEINSVRVTYWNLTPGTHIGTPDDPETPDNEQSDDYVGATKSEFSEAPGATNVLARNFSAAAIDSQGETVEGFEIPHSSILSGWLLAKDKDTTNDDVTDFVYIGKDGKEIERSAVEDANGALIVERPEGQTGLTKADIKKYNPGEQLDLSNGDIYLIADYAGATNYVYHITKVADNYTRGDQNALTTTNHWGHLYIPNTDYINLDGKYVFSGYTSALDNALALTPMPVIPNTNYPDNYGVLQEFVVYSAVDPGEPASNTTVTESIYSSSIFNSNTGSNLNSADYKHEYDGNTWLKTFAATINKDTGEITGITAYQYTLTEGNGGADSVTVTEITGEDITFNLPHAEGATTIPTATAEITTTVINDGTAEGRKVPAITYNQPSDSILVQTEFKQALVKLEMTHTGSSDVYTAFFDDHNAAFGAMMGRYNSMDAAEANLTDSVVTLLAQNLGDLPEGDPMRTPVDGTNGVVDMGMSAIKPNASTATPTFVMDYTLDLNDFTLEMDGVPLLTFANLDATVKNGVIRQSATTWADYPNDPVDTVFDLSEGRFTVENLKIVSHTDTEYNIKVGGNGELHIESGCELGNIYLMEGGPVLDEDGNPVLDDNDEPKMTNDAVAYIDADFDTTSTATVATIYLDGDTGTLDGVWDYANGERVVFTPGQGVTNVKGSEIRARFELADASVVGDTDNASEWFIGTDGKLHQKVRYVVPELVCGTEHYHPTDDPNFKCVLSGGTAVTIPPTEFSVAGYPYFNTYSAVYGFEVDNSPTTPEEAEGFTTTGHEPVFEAQLYNARKDKMTMTNGEVRFLVNSYDGTTSSRLFGFSQTVSDGKAHAVYEDMARADVTFPGEEDGEGNVVTPASPYIVSTTWYGEGEYSSQYARYWNYNYGKNEYVTGDNGEIVTDENGNPEIKTSWGGINGGALSGVVRLAMTEKPISDASISIEAFAPLTAEFIGKNGAALGYTSSPTHGTVRDSHTNQMLINGTDYTPYQVALTTEQSKAISGAEPLETADGKVYYYLKGSNGGKVYYTNNGAGAAIDKDANGNDITTNDNLAGTDLANAKPLNGADVGVYSVELVAVDGSNYTGESGWMGKIFEITPYTGRLIVTGENHIVAKDATTVEAFAKAITAAAGTGASGVTVTDVYGNEIQVTEYSITFETVGGSAALETYNGGKWPAKEGLYNVVIKTNGHDQGTLQMPGVVTYDNPNYAPTAVGYTALLITIDYLGAFIIPETVDVPYTGSIYTDSMVKEFDGNETAPTYQIWQLPIIEATGEPNVNFSIEVSDGSNNTPIRTYAAIIADLEALAASNPDVKRLASTEYRLELGTPYHIPRDADRYTMIATDTSGKYSAIGHLNIVDAEITDVAIDANNDGTYNDDSGVYTGQGHMPGILVTSTDNTRETRVLNANTDYVLTVRQILPGANGVLDTTANEKGTNDDGLVGDDVLGPVIVSPVEAGLYRYNVRGINNYSGSLLDIDYTVVPKSIREGATDIEYKVTYETVTAMYYIGDTVPIVSLYYNGMVLNPGTDYHVTPGTVDTIDTHVITVTGTGNYKDDYVYNLRILQPEGTITLDIPGTYIYNGGSLNSHNWKSSAVFYVTNSSEPLSIDYYDVTATDVNNRPIDPDTGVAEAGIYFVRLTPKAEYVDEEVAGLKSADYAVNTIRIERAPVTLEVKEDEKTYGEFDPTQFSYETDLGTASGFYPHDTASIDGAFSRDPGEDVRNIGYHYSLGTFTAGDNYNITISSETRFHIRSKDISDTSTVIIDAKQTLGYTGYGQSPISSVTYNAPNGNSYSLVENAHYIASYEVWSCDKHLDTETEDPCTPYTCDLSKDDETAEQESSWERNWSSTPLPSNVGWYRVTLDADKMSGFINNYVGKRELIYQITPTAGTLVARVEGEDTVTYSGTAYTPIISVKSADGFSLAESNYTLSYLAEYADKTAEVQMFVPNVTTFTRAGVYTINATGISNYYGASGSAKFTILPKDIGATDDAHGTLSVVIPEITATYTYDGEPKQALITATYDGLVGGPINPDRQLVAGRDYSLNHSNHTNASTETVKATVTVTGTGNYTGERTLTYEIMPQPLTVTVGNTTKVYGELDPAYTYTLTDANNNTVTGVTLTGAVDRAAGEDVNANGYALSLGTLTAGANYELTLAASSLTITAKPIGDENNQPEDRISVSMPTLVSTANTFDTSTANASVTYWAASTNVGTETLDKSQLTITYYVDTNGNKSFDTGDASVASTDTPEDKTTYFAVIAPKNSNYTADVVCTLTGVAADTFLEITATPKDPVYAGPNGIDITLSATQSGVLFSCLYQGVTPVPVNVDKFVATNVGSYVATGTYGQMQGSATVIVRPKDIGENTNMTVGTINVVQPYTGNGVELDNDTLNGLLALTMNNGQKYNLTVGTDFIVTYANNVQPSPTGQATASVTLHGVGNFTGSRTFNFAIGETRFSVTYHRNEASGTAPVDPELHAKGTPAVIAAKNNLSLTYEVDGESRNAIFYGWSERQLELVRDDAQLSGVNRYQPGHTVIVNDNMDLYAVWAADDNGDGIADIDEERYSVFYRSGDPATEENVPEDPNRYLPRTMVKVKDAPYLELEGYTLLGWTRESAPVKIDDAPEYLAYITKLIPLDTSFLIDEANVTLYPVWGKDDGNGIPDWQETSETFYVYYDGNGGAGYFPPQVLNSVLSVKVYNNTFERADYIQVGWTTNRAVNNGENPEHPADIGSELPAGLPNGLPTENGTITLDGKQHYFVPLNGNYIFVDEDHPTGLIIFYALWAENKNDDIENTEPDFNEKRYTVVYNTVDAAGVTSEMPTDNGRYLAGLPITLASEPEGTYNGETVNFLGWTRSSTAAATVLKRGETVADGVTVYSANQVILAPETEPSTENEPLIFYPLWGEADYEITFTIEINPTSTTYNGAPQTPGISVSDHTSQVPAGSYTVTYAPITASAKLDETKQQPLNAGTYSVIVTGKGDYEGRSAVGYYTIAPAELTIKATAEKTYGTPDPDFTFEYEGSVAGETLTFEGALTRVAGEDVLPNGNGYSFIIDGLSETSGNYRLKLAEDAVFTINPKNIGDTVEVIVAEIADRVATDPPSALEPELTIIYYPEGGRSLALKLDADYTVAYANNKTAGSTATVTITAVEPGNYIGTRTVHFKVVAEGLTMKEKFEVTYDGETQPYTTAEGARVLEVKYGTLPLDLNEDYTVEFTVLSSGLPVDGMPVDAGVYVIHVSGAVDTDYEGMTTQGTLIINPATIDTVVTDPALDADGITIPYTGEAQAPSIESVKSGEIGLGTTDYDVTYRNKDTNVVSTSKPTDVGEYELIVTGKGNFDGSIAVPFEIIAGELEVGRVDDSVYTGKPYLPEPNVTSDNNVELTLNTDYTLSYRSASGGTNTVTPVNAGDYTVVVTGKGNYLGAEDADDVANFTIAPKALDNSDKVGEIYVVATDAVYTGDPVTTTVVVTYKVDGSTLYLVEGTDYTLSYENNTAVGNSATVIVTAIAKADGGSGNYSKSTSAAFRILPAEGKSFTVAIDPTSTTYNGEAQTPTVTVTADNGDTLTLNTDYTVTYEPLTDGAKLDGDEPLNAGTYTVVVTGTGDTYSGYAGSATYVILPAPITSVKVNDDSFTYNGSAHIPQSVSVTSAVTTSIGADILTLNPSDYTLEYYNNVDAGTATVAAVGTGNFTGVATTEFTIEPATIYITPNGTTKVYGTEDNLSYTVSGTGTPTGKLTREGGEDVGEYAIILDTLTAPNGNYKLAFSANATTVFTITPKSLAHTTEEGVDIDPQETVTIITTNSTFSADLFSGEAITTYDSAFGLMLLGLDDYTLSYTAVGDGATLNEKNEPASFGTYDVEVKATADGNYADSYTFRLMLAYSAEQTLDASLTNTHATYSGSDLFDYAGLTVTNNPNAGGTLTNLTWKTDYTYTISKDTETGTVTVTEVVDVGAYTIAVTGAAGTTYAGGKDTVTFFIYAKNIEDKPDGVYDVKIDTIDSITYDGTAQTPTPTVTFNGKELKLGTDYTLAYADNLNVGTATVTITGRGNFTGSRVVEFKITPATLSVGELKDKDYIAEPHTQKPTVTGVGGKTLVENVDYTLTQTGDNIKAGEVKFTVEGTGNYTTVDGNPVDESFLINQRSINANGIIVTVIPDRLTVANDALKPVVSIYDSELGLMLVEGTDFTVAYTANTAVGTATVTVTGKGNYKDSTTTTFEILANVSGLTVALSPNDTGVYDATNHWSRLALAVTDGNGDAVTGYTLSYSHNGVDKGTVTETNVPQFVNVGTYVITVTGAKGSAYEGSVGTVIYTITPGTFTVNLQSGSEIIADGTEKEPPLVVSGDKGEGSLDATKDYVAEYSNNVLPGTARIVVTGIGNYAGCVRTVEFTILSSKVFKVTYNANGGSGAPTDLTEYREGQVTRIADGKPTLSGATFLGWVMNTAPALVTSAAQQPADADIYTAGETFTVSGNTTFYALWAEDKNGNGIPDYADTFTITASAGLGGTISVKPAATVAYGTDVVVTITEVDGYTLSGVTVDGKTVSVVKTDTGYTYTFTNVTADHTIVASFSKTTTTIIPGGGGGGGGGGTDPDPDPETPPPGGGSTTPDLIRDKHFAYVQGKGEVFDPNGNMTRAEVATILVRLMTGEMEIPTGYETRFPDVDPNKWYHDAIAYLEQFGILNGYPDGTFRPENPITRAEFAAMMMRFYEVEDWTGDKIFIDLPESHWAYDYINSAHAYGFVLGYTDGSFAPDQHIRRAEAVALLNRVLERVADEPYIDGHLNELVTYPDVETVHWAYYDILEASNGHDFTYDFGDEDWIGIWPNNVDPNDTDNTASN